MDLSRVRNAARDMTKAMVRFERDFARYQREVIAAMDDGATSLDIGASTAEAVAGHPDLERKLAEFSDALAREAA